MLAGHDVHTEQVTLRNTSLNNFNIIEGNVCVYEHMPTGEKARIQEYLNL